MFTAGQSPLQLCHLLLQFIVGRSVIRQRHVQALYLHGMGNNIEQGTRGSKWTRNALMIFYNYYYHFTNTTTITNMVMTSTTYLALGTVLLLLTLGQSSTQSVDCQLQGAGLGFQVCDLATERINTILHHLRNAIQSQSQCLHLIQCYSGPSLCSHPQGHDLVWHEMGGPSSRGHLYCLDSKRMMGNNSVQCETRWNHIAQYRFVWRFQRGACTVWHHNVAKATAILIS